ncbi:Fe-S cluster assembly protein SufD, partial [Mammaliicoccus vitulinus]
MATETKLNINIEDIVNYSASQNEPKWMTDLRKESFQNLDKLEMPKPDKTKIGRWDFDTFKTHAVESDTFDSIESLPESVQKIIDTENNTNLIVQHNNTTAFVNVDE